MFKAVVFDFDGLILDTETPWYQVYSDLYKEYGFHLSLDIYAKYLGTTSPAEDLARRTSLDATELDEIAGERHVELMRGQQVRPGVEDYLQTARKIGLKVGLASSSNRNWVEGHLRDHRLYDYFDCVVTSDDVNRVKPDPELYLTAVDRLGVNASKAMAFEDSPNGARAAKRAGLYCVVVPTVISGQLPFDAYDRRISSMAERPLTDILKDPVST